MSTSETDEFDVCACPCGKGKIIKTVTTQDNPWSSADISFALVCGDCRKQWRLERSKLVKISSEADFKAAQIAERQAYQALEQQINPLANAYFEGIVPRTKKAVHAEMVRLGLSSSTYRSFLSRMRDAKSVAATCYPLGNKTWLRGLARRADVLAALDKALREYEEARKRSSEASQRIVYWPFPRSNSIL